MSKSTQCLESIMNAAENNVLRIERWRDEYKHWRVGINWFSEDEFDFVVEKPTLEECMLAVDEFLTNSQE